MHSAPTGAQASLYDTLAVPWYPGEHQPVSIEYVLRQMGAVPVGVSGFKYVTGLLGKMPLRGVGIGRLSSKLRGVLQGPRASAPSSLEESSQLEAAASACSVSGREDGKSNTSEPSIPRPSCLPQPLTSACCKMRSSFREADEEDGVQKPRSRKSCADISQLSISRPGRDRTSRNRDQGARPSLSTSSTCEELRDIPAQASASSGQSRRRTTFQQDRDDHRAHVAHAFSEEPMLMRSRSGALTPLHSLPEASHGDKASSHDLPKQLAAEDDVLFV